ncbi:hypothetical protein NDI85_17010 [Halomicroarcula sp. S1AR25-4]|uniref:YIP1 family protein n=1 Tax=Haloarcula sp. S1AR25-4 TaxID=2950538 RepID=UPI002876D1CE|nr:YIP1 family protein [Halomicroarcula sp. S1AR25-4]MDS0279495.1 hypothetical protein [Halomicroarcula sp. S1AR25-4]
MSRKQYNDIVPLVLDLLFDLKVIAERRELDQLWTPAAIVLLAAVSNLFSSIASVMWIVPAIPGSTTELYLISTVTAVLLPLTVWLGSGVAFYVIATLRFIDVDLRETIWLTGVGMLPYVVSSLLGTAATLFAITQVPAPESVQLVQARSSLIQSLTVVRFANLLHLIALLWTGVNWIEMGSAVWDVPTTRAAKIVCGPLLLLVLIFARLKVLN